MKVNLFNIDKMIRVNDIKKVTDPVTLEKGNIPTSKGILSMDIFGRNQKDRKEIFGHIDLKEKFIHPLVYKTLIKLDRKFESLISGKKYYSLDTNGFLIETSQENGGRTGLEYLYSIFDKINFKKNDSNSRQEKLDFIESLSKDEIFCDKFLVCPPFYRDINLQKDDKVSLGDINYLYAKLIRLTAGLEKDSSGLSFVGNATRNEIESTIIQIYDYFLDDKIKGKNGFFRQALLGKTTDYGARLVISAPLFKCETPDDMDITFDRCGVPLHMCCSMFTPFILFWLRNFFVNEFTTNEKYPVMNHKTKEIEYKTLKDPIQFFNNKYIKENIDKFVSSGNGRYEFIKLPTEDGSDLYLSFRGRYYKEGVPESESPLINRPATWTDLIYMACVEMLSDKHVMVTRYPITSYFSIFPNKIFVLSTYKTVPMYVGGKVYKAYPVIDLENNRPENDFINTLRIFNPFLKGMGGD